MENNNLQILLDILFHLNNPTWPDTESPEAQAKRWTTWVKDRAILSHRYAATSYQLQEPVVKSYNTPASS